jgi:hypothetical protein
MTTCLVCAGYGNRHDPIAHGWVTEPTWDGRMTHDDIAEIAFQTINACHTEGIHDPLRQAHAIAVALLYAEEDR